jgi:WD40 repeat protein
MRLVSKEVRAISQQVPPPWPVLRFRPGRQLVTCVAFSPDNLNLAAAAKKLYIWDRREGVRRTIGTHPCVALAYTCDGRWLITADSIRNELLIWNVPEFSLQQRLEFRTQEDPGTTHISVSPDNVHFATWGYDSVIRLWKISSESIVQQQDLELQTGLTGYDTVTFGPSREDLAYAVDKHTIRIQALNNSQQYTDVEAAHRITLIRYTPNGKQLLIGFGNGTIRLYGVTSRSWSSTNVLLEKDQYVTCVAFSSNNKVAVGCGPKIFVYSYETIDDLCLLTTIRGHRDRVESVVFGSDNRTLVSGGDKSVIYWDIYNTKRFGY